MRYILILVLCTSALFAGDYSGRIPPCPVKFLNDYVISIDEQETLSDNWTRCLLQNRGFGLRHPVAGIPNASELYSLVFVMRLATGKRNDQRQWGIYHIDDRFGSSADDDKSVSVAINVLLDTFSQWLVDNPPELDKYKALIQSKMKNNWIAKRSDGPIDYDSFLKVLAKRMAVIPEAGKPEDPEYVDNLWRLLKKFKNIYCTPEMCQEAEESTAKELQRRQETLEKSHVDHNRKPVFEDNNAETPNKLYSEAPGLPAQRKAPVGMRDYPDLR